MILFACPAFAHMAHALRLASGLRTGEASLSCFPNGERAATLQTQVAGEDCLLLGSLAPPDEQLLAFLLLSHTLHKENARTITALLPYLAYARQDQREEGASLAAAWVGTLLQAVGVTRVVTVDVHSPATQACFPLPLVSLSPASLFAREIARLEFQQATLVAPDQGVRERCQAVARATGMDAHITQFQKYRSVTGVVHIGINGPVGPSVVIVNDILDTGATLISCCEQLYQRGACDITIFVTHGQFTGQLWQRLWSLNVQRIWCTDTILLAPTDRPMQVQTLSVVPVLQTYVQHLSEEERNA